MTRAELEGEVYGWDSRYGYVSIRIGLTPKVIRFPTSEAWEKGARVRVTVEPIEPEELVMVGGLDV